MLQGQGFELGFAIALAGAQGVVMYEAFHGTTERHKKADGTDVTDADIKINTNTNAAYARRGVGVSGEESSTAPYGSRNAAVVDPIDDTKDFIAGQLRTPRTSRAAYALGVIRETPEIGVVNFPLLRVPRLYGAQKHGPARLYDASGGPRVLHVAHEAVRGAVLLSSSSYEDELAGRVVAAGLRPIRISGAVFKAVALTDRDLLEGLLDPDEVAVGFIARKGKKSVKLHDYAASSVIVESAGGIATSPSGGPLSLEEGPQGCVMSANRRIHDCLLELAAG